ncbi:UDP-N-acetylmuramate:L-alanyl-gamma-D-glutamyl-meso-diaminopimelate ligase [Halorhodospira halophila]|uniref:UDP-N-acetylmuramate--L-alanyl-gamma-D-glutamyl-meso-2,6-diaminoheptandioate ligase n=1 Tax=Halorhodospira halophila (strain DSM 244 / SL1) TaxID=349124 RepID=A1WYK9_HALHL|nr:UDP-N-acetylmuramate:L-alanyl-gamma-D-glutamyl-meso-diaminopimelate ligase [Halorhodospira halophila]ABM62771.1 UDP-N-acetylmuramate [Halorhodospira halophila SL1]MBK1728106.1 UDP-N-acetylmuramate:L-alanyl-gamma-D-glutamyl-meso-diaminopimelate ligase [Halorhodospira halophila]
MKIHILGICGTFMGGIALLARESGHAVEGSDSAAWPPMSDILDQAGVPVRGGYDATHLEPAPDRVIIGNALSRGNPAIEYTLDRGLPYQSGPGWLAEHVLTGRCVVAIAGTHGKTTTASMATWILERCGLDPGYLIGGAPGFSERSARLGTGSPFVVEADEYDTAFFDKRAKVVHYQPRVLLLNNLEFDHADIYPDLEAIATQLHHAIRTVPANGRVLINGDDPHLPSVVARGCWSRLERIGFGADNDWRIDADEAAEHAVLVHRGTPLGALQPPQPGRHNLANAAAAVAAAASAGADPTTAVKAINEFPGVRRRLELRGCVDGVEVIDDFAHHPSAVAATLNALATPGRRLLAVLEPRSNTMRLGIHRHQLAEALGHADQAFVLTPPDLPWSVSEALAPLGERLHTAAEVSDLARLALAKARPGDCLVVMSNGAFGDIHERLLTGLRTRGAPA